MDAVAADTNQPVASGLAIIRLSTAVSDLPGIGAHRAKLLGRLGIATVKDLIQHLPLRYERELAEGAIGDLAMGAISSARGTVVAARVIGPPRGKGGRFQATLQDHSDRLDLVWFNAAYLRQKIHPGMVLRVQGKTVAYRGYAQMVNPRWEELKESDEAPDKDERLRPVYPATESLPSLVLEKVVGQILPQVLPQIADPLPPALLAAHNLPALADAFRMVHQPAHEDEAGAARRRLAYNELLLLQLGILLKRHHNRTGLRAPALRWSEAIDEHIRERFPFPLTAAQDRAIAQITADLWQSQPMNRLLQGDVGSGKTVVALYALLLAVANRQQGALMTPTELLADQHFLSIGAMLNSSNVRIALLTGAAAAAGSRERAELLAQIESGAIDIVIGTQALLTESVRFNQLGVVVVDEQHRFGVLQRAKFRTKGGGVAPDVSPPAAADGDQALEQITPPLPVPQASPHYLVMTATPIPRSLSLTVFGDLDISTIDALPPGRTPITTRVVGPEKADDVYQYMAKRVARGEQAYVVVPIIDDSGEESTRDLKNVQAHARLLQDKYCRGMRVAALHGRLKRDTRAAIMQKFRAGQVQVLVATTVIEVGVDVPNATMMIVEHAERFGLAQLHQLRGRIGRGSAGKKSVCVFIAEPGNEDAAGRIKAIAATTDGFKIAEADLEIRGMGEFFGTRQAGQASLRVARIPEDMDLLQLARHDAQHLLESDPALLAPASQRLRKLLIQQHGEALGLIDVG